MHVQVVHDAGERPRGAQVGHGASVEVRHTQRPGGVARELQEDPPADPAEHPHLIRARIQDETLGGDAAKERRDDLQDGVVAPAEGHGELVASG